MQKYRIPQLPKWSLHFSWVRATLAVLWNKNAEEEKTMTVQQGKGEKKKTDPPLPKHSECFPLPLQCALPELCFCTDVFCVTCWGSTAGRAFPRVCEAPETHQGQQPRESSCEIAAPEGPWAQPWATGAFQAHSTTNDAKSQQLPCIYSVTYAPGDGITEENSLRKFFGEVQRVTTFIPVSRGVERVVFLVFNSLWLSCLCIPSPKSWVFQTKKAV